MTQLVEQDVRAAYIEVGRSWEQIAATTATRELQEQTLQAEVESSVFGRSDRLCWSRRPSAICSPRKLKVQARTSYLNAIVNLYRLEGSLLERRGIRCPGRDPVMLDDSPAALSARHDESDAQ